MALRRLTAASQPQAKAAASGDAIGTIMVEGASANGQERAEQHRRAGAALRQLLAHHAIRAAADGFNAVACCKYRERLPFVCRE